MVEYNEKEKSLQISVHLFIDDLEESLKKEGTNSILLFYVEFMVRKFKGFKKKLKTII